LNPTIQFNIIACKIRVLLPVVKLKDKFHAKDKQRVDNHNFPIFLSRSLFFHQSISKYRERIQNSNKSSRDNLTYNHKQVNEEGQVRNIGLNKGIEKRVNQVSEL